MWRPWLPALKRELRIVVFEGGKPDDTKMQKVENDAEAFLRSYVKRRGRKRMPR